MPKRNPNYRDCTETCKSELHATDLINAINSSPSVISDKQLASFLKHKCYCFDQVKDEFGRTVLHVASSYGRKNLCQWLIKCNNADINAIDLESGYTPLHRSIYNGFINIAVSLIQLGANITLTDNEDYFPIDLVLRNLNLDFFFYSVRPKFETQEINGTAVLDYKLNQKIMIQTNMDYDSLNQISVDKRNILDALSYGTEVYTWGTNHNYTSGFGAENSKMYPEYLEFFERKNEVIVEVHMHKCHTLFLSISGNVWCCGLGKGGRLGLSSDETVLVPQKILLTSNIYSANSSPKSSLSNLFCIKAAIGQDHSIFLCSNNQVMICGMNIYHQLGILPPPVLVIKPQVVDIELGNENILGVAASTFHSVVWTSYGVYSCGFHGGQLGHPCSNEKTVPSFKKVSAIQFQRTSIIHAAASEGATVLVTDVNNIYVLSNYKCQKIDFRNIMKYESMTEAEFSCRKADLLKLQDNVKSCPVVIKIAVIGGTLDLKKIKTLTSTYHPEVLKIAVLLWNGSVFLWKENKPFFIRCNFLVRHEINVSDIVLNSSSMLLASRKGEAFTARIHTLVKTFPKRTSGFTMVNHHNTEESDESYLMKLNKIPNAHRTISLFCDPKGNNFCILQNRSADILENLPRINMWTSNSDFEKLYYECNELDMFHDVVYQVGTKSFAAHKYILASCSEEFIAIKPSDGGTVIIKNIHPEIFQQLLLFAYTGNCCLFQQGKCSLNIQKTNTEKSVSTPPVKYENPIKLALIAAEIFKMNEFICRLQKYRYENGFIYAKNYTSQPLRIKYSRMKYKTLYDLKLKSKDGQIFNAHKCILIARMEYFKNMLSGNWKETNNDYEYNMPISTAVLLEMLEFVYTDTVIKPVIKKDWNFWCNLLVAADQFILPKLKAISENALAQCLDVRNASEMLLFADMIDAVQLKTAIYEFISINLASFLYARELDRLNDELLYELTQYYKYFFLNEKKKIQTYSNVCDYHHIIDIDNNFPVQWEVDAESFQGDKNRRKPFRLIQKKKTKRKRKSSLSETENNVIVEKKSDIKCDDYNNKEINRHIFTNPVDNESVTNNSIKEKWIEVDRQLKSVKSRLKVNAMVKEFPEIVEQKENFIPLVLKKTIDISTSDLGEMSVPDNNYKSSVLVVNIESLNITSKLSQKQRKQSRTVSICSKSEEFDAVTPKVESPADSKSTHCWGTNKHINKPVSFSAIMASEKKLKTLVKKETKKIETKPLHLTQVEDKAIQDLIAFYNANYVDEEHITVQRVIYDTEAPQWIKNKK